MPAGQADVTKVTAKGGLTSVRRKTAEDPRFDCKIKRGGSSVDLKATNRWVVRTGKRCEPEQAGDNDIRSLQNNAADAMVEDLTV